MKGPHRCTIRCSVGMKVDEDRGVRTRSLLLCLRCIDLDDYAWSLHVSSVPETDTPECAWVHRQVDRELYVKSALRD